MTLVAVTVTVSGCGGESAGGGSHTGGTGGGTGGLSGHSGTGGGRGGTGGYAGHSGSGGIGGACTPRDGQDAATTADAGWDASTTDTDAAATSGADAADGTTHQCPATVIPGDSCSTEGLLCGFDTCHSCTGGSGYIYGSRLCNCRDGKWVGCINLDNDCIGFDGCSPSFAPPGFYFRDSACTVPFCASSGDAACR